MEQTTAPSATKVLAERLAQIEQIALSSGSHEEFEHGMCVMEVR